MKGNLKFCASRVNITAIKQCCLLFVVNRVSVVTAIKLTSMVSRSLIYDDISEALTTGSLFQITNVTDISTLKISCPQELHYNFVCMYYIFGFELLFLIPNRLICKLLTKLIYLYQ